jgi:hypothetical protein
MVPILTTPLTLHINPAFAPAPLPLIGISMLLGGDLAVLIDTALVIVSATDPATVVSASAIESSTTASVQVTTRSWPR